MITISTTWFFYFNCDNIAVSNTCPIESQSIGMAFDLGLRDGRYNCLEDRKGLTRGAHIEADSNCRSVIRSHRAEIGKGGT